MTEYVGLDVSKEETSFCILDRAGLVLAHGRVKTDPGSIFAALRSHCQCPSRIVLESGTSAFWLTRGLRGCGLPVDVIDARQAHGVMGLQVNKTDANDARLLAEIARTGFCRPIAVKSESAQEHRIMLKARQHLLRQRCATENVIRGLLATVGQRLAAGTGRFAERVEAAMQEHPALAPALLPVLAVHATLVRELRRLDRVVAAEAMAQPACRLLMTTPGVGPVTALAFLATIDEAGRFAHSRAVGAYLGLTTRRRQSGEMDYSGRISKQGDAMLRSLLYEAATSLLCRVRRAHPLKDWARRIKRRSSHKKACVALARKLAVILHRMLVTGEAFRWPEPEPAQAV